MQRLLVTGACGFLGRTVLFVAAKDFELHGTVYNTRDAVVGAELHRLDLSSRSQVDALFSRLAPHGVIHTAALSSPEACQRDQEASYRANVSATVNVARACARHHVALLHVSTDLVFAGLDAPYAEDDPPDPVSVYGRHKAMAEQEALDAMPEALVVRLPLLFGPAYGTRTGFLAPLAKALTEGVQVRLFTDEYRTPAYSLDTARFMVRMLGRAQGLLHLGGPRRISRFDFGHLVAKSLGVAHPNIVPSLQREARLAAPRPPDVSLDGSRARRLGFAPADPADALAESL